MMHISEQGIALICRFEGFSPRAYICPAGYRTIGYGHVIGVGENFPEPISEAEAQAFLRKDVRLAEQAVFRLIVISLQQNQFDSLVSFTFNLGAGALQRSALRRLVNRSEHAGVPQELLRWVWAGGQKLPGLQRRREAEGVLYNTSR